MNPNKALWEKGDFTAIAAYMREAGENLVSSVGVPPNARVLDVGCGDGTTALPLARMGAQVLGVDIARNLLEAGSRRAVAAGLYNLKFEEGDVCDLAGIGDNSFDLTISIFGAMFAPRAFDAARELVRVTKSGGRIVMGNWIPDDPTSFVSQLLKISAAYSPPPPDGFISPVLWGVESHVVERFHQAGVPAANINMERDIYTFESAEKGPASFVYALENFYGPTMNAFEAAAKNGRTEELRGEILDLATEHNRDIKGGTRIPATFMRVTVTV